MVLKAFTLLVWKRHWSLQHCTWVLHTVKTTNAR